MPSPPPPPAPRRPRQRRRSWYSQTNALFGWINLALCSTLALACAATLPLIVIASLLLPFVGLVAVPALVAVATCLFLLVPAAIRLAFGDSSAVLPLPIRLLHPLQNLRLLVTTYRTLLDIKQSGLLTLYLQSLSNRLLRFGGGDGRFPLCDERPWRDLGEEQIRQGIVYVPANVELGLPAKRLDIYLPLRSCNAEDDDDLDDKDDKENRPTVPVVILLGFASYRLAGDTQSFPIPNLAHQIQSSLGGGGGRVGVVVVVPSLTAFTSASAGGNETTTTILERMVGETRECIKWVGENIARYGGDAGKIWVMGYGAGAHIASLTLVQSAVVASREAYLSQQAALRARLAQQEGLVSVDAESVASPSSHAFAAPRDSADSAHRAPPPPPPQPQADESTKSRRRERVRSKADSSGISASNGGGDKSTEMEMEEAAEEEDEDEIERLLRRSRSTRRFGTPSLLDEEQQQQQEEQQQHRRRRRQVSWSDVPVPVPAHEPIPLPPIPLDYHQPIGLGGRRVASAESANGGDADDLREEGDEIGISDGVRSCRLFTLASLEEEEEKVYDPAASQDVIIGVATDESILADSTKSFVVTEPEFGFASRLGPRSLASFEMPPHPSVSSGSSTKKAGKRPIHRGGGGGGGGGGGKGVGLGKQVEIRGMILVEGTYDVVKQAKWDHECGVEEVSSLTRLCVAPHRDYLHACPSHLLYAASPLLSHTPDRNTAAATPPAPLSRRFLPPNVLLIHGGADHLSPFSPAVLFRNLLLGVGLESDHVHVKLYRHLSAMGALAALTGETEYASLLFDEIADVLDADEEGSGDAVQALHG